MISLYVNAHLCTLQHIQAMKAHGGVYQDSLITSATDDRWSKPPPVRIKGPVFITMDTGWTPEQVWTDVKIRPSFDPTRVRIPNYPYTGE